jgi:hypothetical protein
MDANFQIGILRIRSFIQKSIFIRVPSRPFAVENPQLDCLFMERPWNFQNGIPGIRDFIRTAIFLRVPSRPFAVDGSLAGPPWCRIQGP